MDYTFNKPLFWGIIGLIIILYGFVVVSEGGFQQKQFISCSGEAYCDNPLYQEGARDYPYNVPRFQGTLGEKPGWLYLNFSWLVVLIVFLGVIFNHLRFNKGKDPFNGGVV